MSVSDGGADVPPSDGIPVLVDGTPAPSDSQHNFDRTSSVASDANDGTDDNSTLTGSRSLVKPGQQKHEDLRLLAASAQMTEASYSVSDIHTRIFEIQELRHQDLGSNNINGSSTSTSLSTVIDQALIGLDERLEAVAQNIALITSALEPLTSDPTLPARLQSDDMAVMVLRKHGALLQEWEGVQREAEILRDELKEDKWLLVFRNASDQADGMMNSLERIVDQCQSFLETLRETNEDDHGFIVPSRSNSASFTELHKSLQAKEKYYVPSVSKVLAVLDKGVRIRATKNGECLRRHADMRIRWKSLREKITNIDAVMDATAKALDSEGQSDEDSAVSQATNLDTPDRSTASSTTSALARSISPFRKFAAKMSRSTSSKEPTTPVRPSQPRQSRSVQGGQSEPTIRRRISLMTLGTAESQVGNAPRPSVDSYDTASAAKPSKPRWNVSTQPLPSNSPSAASTIKQSTPPPRRPSSSLAWSAPGPRSSSRMSTSRSVSSQIFPPRPPSRQTQPRSESRSALIRQRPSSPTQIPAPNFSRNFSDAASASAVSDEDYPPTSLMQRAMTPSASSNSNTTPQGTPQKSGARRQSLLPLPKGGLRAPSPSFSRSVSPSYTSVSGYTQHDGEGTTPSRPPRSAARPKPAPSSFNFGPSSRPPSRNRERSMTPGVDRDPFQVHEYVPGNPKDPLDTQIAAVANSVIHGFLVERVDPHWRRPPPPGEEIKAQYAFSNAYGRKILACKLLVIQRAAPKTLAGHVQTKKVMCRIGGGWQDLETFLLSHSGA